MTKPAIWENLVCSIFHKYYLSTNLSPSFRPIAGFTLEIERYLCDHVVSTEIEKIWPKGVATYAYSASVYYVCNLYSIIMT